MIEITEKYYMANDGKKFTDENECREYEEAKTKVEDLKTQIHALNKELACAEYIMYGKGKYVARADGHDGYYNKCPNCGANVGGYERLNTKLNVDRDIYKCEKCGEFFMYR